MAQAITVSDFGGIYQRAGNYRQALDNYQQALQMHTDVTGNKLHQAFALRRIAVVYSELGDYTRSLDYQNRSVQRFQEEGYRHYAGAGIGNIGHIYRLLGDYARALECYEESLKSAREFHDKKEEERNLSSIGDLYIRRGEYAKAQQHLERSLQLAGETGNFLFKGGCLIHLGEVYKRTGDYTKALQYLEEGMKVLKGQGHKYRLGQGWNSLGDLYLGLQRPNDAIKCFETALAIGKETGVLEIVWEAQSGLGRAQEQKGGYTEALDHYGAAINAIENIRSQLQLPEQKSSFLESKLKVYERTVDLVARLNEKDRAQGFDRQAFAYAERGKARAFLDLLAEAKAHVEAGIDRDLLQKRYHLTAQLSKGQTRLRDAFVNTDNQTNPSQSKTSADTFTATLVERLKKEQVAFEKESEQLQREIRRRNPKYADVHYPQPIALEQAQKLLDEESALLEYVIGEDSSFLFAITNRAYRLYKLRPSAGSLTVQVKELRALIMKTTDPLDQALGGYAREFSRRAGDLYQVLVAPAEKLLADKKRLIIVPDGALVYLPFEALLSSPHKAAAMDFTKLSYLIKKYSIQYAPSATVLSTLKTPGEKAPVKQKEFLAFADPDYQGRRKAGPVQRSMTRGVVQGTLARLPYSGIEAKSIAKIFPPGESDLFLRRKAREDIVKTGVDLSAYKNILFSAHGLLNEERPQFSSIVLTLEDTSTEDGFLQVHEIFNLKLNAELVVLSACQTALGKQVRGEGLIALSRAFMYAGTPSVVASLWEVSDPSTAVLMKHFFTDRHRLDKTDALRQAKQQMMKSRRYAHPFYWAGFVLIGER
ncbi:MAG: CHAT domain-containing protein [Acidobacteria bacterium]|nr:CHAT domain-containing protein [Acidobacteriota bacterium]MBI3657719.1 CHAT domain-containing protein [Acidobacteriota bacterium]